MPRRNSVSEDLMLWAVALASCGTIKLCEAIRPKMLFPTRIRSRAPVARTTRAAVCVFVAFSGAGMVVISFRRYRPQPDDFVTAQGLEKWLKAAADHTAQRGTVDFDLADARCTPDLLGRGRAHEAHLDSLYLELERHAPQPREPVERGNRWNY